MGYVEMGYLVARARERHKGKGFATTSVGSTKARARAKVKMIEQVRVSQKEPIGNIQ